MQQRPDYMQEIHPEYLTLSNQPMIRISNMEIQINNPPKIKKHRIKNYSRNLWMKINKTQNTAKNSMILFNR